MQPADLVPPRGARAAPHADLTPHKDEAHRLAGAAGFKDQGKADTTDCADPPASDQPGADDTKRFANLRALLALAGWALSRNAAGDGQTTYSAARWNMARELAGLDAVAEFADRVGATR